MPEKKAVTEKAKTPKVIKPTVKKVAAKKTTLVPKPKTASTKVPSTKTKSAPVATPEVIETKASKVIEQPKAVAEVTKPVEKPEIVVAAAKPAIKPDGKKVLKGKVLKITLVKSGIGYSKRHKATLKALGFRRLNQTIEQVDTPSLRGMLALVNHLVRIEEQGTK
jgi:large subunit ribosomal protein L30